MSLCPDPSLAAAQCRAVFEKSTVGIIHFDAQGVIQVCNQAFADVIGAPREAMQGFAMLDRVTHPGVLQAIQQGLAGEEACYEGPYLSVSSGRPSTIHLRVIPHRAEDGAILGGTGLVENRTEFAKVELSYRALVDQAADAILVGDPAGAIVDANEQVSIVTGFSRNQLFGRHIRTLFTPKSLSDAPLRFDLLDQHQRVTSRRDILKADGSICPVEMTSCKLADGRYQTIIRDISLHQQSEQSLREAERRYRDLFDNTPDNLFRIALEPDGGFRIEDVNPAQAVAFGVAREAMVGKRLEELLPPELLGPIQANYERCLNSGQIQRYEEVANLPSGHRWFETLLVPIHTSDGVVRHLVGFSRDITARKRTEEALLQASKLESLGVLAGGIAHDFNNLLTAILGNLNLAQAQATESASMRPFLESAEKTVLKAAELTKQLLAYSGKGRFVVKPHDFNHVVQEMTHLLQVSISKRISLRFRLAPELPPVEADAAQIQQVIMNLVTNASDAIGDREGTITLSTETHDLDAPFLSQAFPGQPLAPGSYVQLEVADSGCGMTPEVLARIFDPFFSTKATGRGLGLSAMMGILRGHGAGLKIYSEVGRGTTFKLMFPASKQAVPLPTPLPEGDARSFSGLALVVDDEPLLRETASAALESMGFQVLTAVDGKEALDLHAAHGTALRLVLLDLTMPRLDGRQTFQILHRKDPSLPIVLSSGYSEQESVETLIGRGLAGFIQKPYTLRELKRVIAQALEAAP